MRVPILRSIGTKLTKLENMQISRFIWFIWRHVTQKRYVMRHGDFDTSGTFWNQPEVSTTSGSKVMAQIVVFVYLVTLTLTFDLCSIVCHTHCAWCTGISMRSFIRIRPVILGDMPWTHTHIHTHTPKVILIVSRNARLMTVIANMENVDQLLNLNPFKRC